VYVSSSELKLNIKSFICPTNAQLNCFKMLKFTLRFTINAFIVNLNVNFNMIQQFNCALVGQ